ncbi:hypothetical protein MRX96_010633 [Rhipicephalus microplus]
MRIRASVEISASARERIKGSADLSRLSYSAGAPNEQCSTPVRPMYQSSLEASCARYETKHGPSASGISEDAAGTQVAAAGHDRSLAASPPDCYKRQQKQAKRLQPTRLRHASAAEMRLSRRQAGRLAIDVDKGLRRHSGGRQGPQLRRPPAHDVDKGPSSVSQKRVTCLARETPSPARYSAHLASQCDTGRPATRLVQPANLRSRNGIATAESNDEKVRRRCASWLEK